MSTDSTENRPADHPAALANAAVKAGRLAEALAWLTSLAQQEPQEAAWPRKLADVHRRLGDRDSQQDCLQRAARLYADRGFVIQAIAACREILSVDPTHSETQQRLEDLCARSVSGWGTDPNSSDVRSLADSAPLEELELTDVVPGAQTADWGPEVLEQASAIPLESRGDRTAPDLDVDPSGWDEARCDDAGCDNVANTSPSETLRNTPLFGALTASALRSLIRRVRVVEIAEGETLFRQGDRADALYVVVDGAVVPIAESDGPGSPETRLAVLEAGAFFGETGLVTRQPRNATIRALVDTRLLAVDRRIMWELVRSQPETLRVVLRFLRERLVDRLVRTSPLFEAFSHADRGNVARQFDFLEVRDAQVVIAQDQPAPGLFIVLAGHLDVAVVEAEGDKILARLGPGEFCGERSLLRREPAMAGVISSGKCWLLALPEARFRRIADRNPELARTIARILEAREQENDDALSQPSLIMEAGIGLI